MLNVNSLIGGATLGFIGWIAFSVVDLKTETAVIAVKVDQNHKMLAELWDYYLQGWQSRGSMAISRGRNASGVARQISKPPQKRKWSPKVGTGKKRVEDENPKDTVRKNCKRPRGFS